MSTQSATHSLSIGDQAPSFELPATDGQTYSLGSFQDRRYLTIIFLANHCPYVASWEDRIIAVARDFGDRDVAFAAVSSNDATRFPQDSFEEMDKRVRDMGYPFPYLYDETQSVARAFGATRTPEVFVFDGERRLVYHGAVDSDFEENPGYTSYLRDALEALLAGKPVPEPETHVLGCVLKYRE